MISSKSSLPGLRRFPANHERPADAGQPAPDFILIKHDDREDDVSEEIGEEPLECAQAVVPREGIKAQQDDETEGHLRPPRPAQKEQEAVDEESDDQNIEDVAERVGRVL